MENNTNTEELTADAKLIQAKALLEYLGLYRWGTQLTRIINLISIS